MVWTISRPGSYLQEPLWNITIQWPLVRVAVSKSLNIHADDSAVPSKNMAYDVEINPHQLIRIARVTASRYLEIMPRPSLHSRTFPWHPVNICMPCLQLRIDISTTTSVLCSTSRQTPHSLHYGRYPGGSCVWSGPGTCFDRSWELASCYPTAPVVTYTDIFVHVKD